MGIPNVKLRWRITWVYLRWLNVNRLRGLHVRETT